MRMCNGRGRGSSSHHHIVKDISVSSRFKILFNYYYSYLILQEANYDVYLIVYYLCAQREFVGNENATHAIYTYLPVANTIKLLIQ